MKHSTAIRRLGPPALVALLMLAVPALALGHARVSPAVSVSGQLQLYSLAVPTEKAHVTTAKIVMTVPKGLSIDSFVPPPPGWHQRVASKGSGEDAIVQKVTWTGGHTPTGEDSLFQFLAQPASTGTYTFKIRQTYSDGSIVNWTGAESSESPAPTITVASSLGGGSGTSTLTIVALIVGVLGLLAAGAALVGRDRHPPNAVTGAPAPVSDAPTAVADAPSPVSDAPPPVSDAPPPVSGAPTAAPEAPPAASPEPAPDASERPRRRPLA